MRRNQVVGGGRGGCRDPGRLSSCPLGWSYHGGGGRGETGDSREEEKEGADNAKRRRGRRNRVIGGGEKEGCWGPRKLGGEGKGWWQRRRDEDGRQRKENYHEKRSPWDPLNVRKPLARGRNHCSLFKGKMLSFVIQEEDIVAD